MKSHRAKNNLSKSLRSKGLEAFTSVTSRHHFDTGNQVDTLKSFTVINGQPNFSLLEFFEAITTVCNQI